MQALSTNMTRMNENLLEISLEPLTYASGTALDKAAESQDLMEERNAWHVQSQVWGMPTPGCVDPDQLLSRPLVNERYIFIEMCQVTNCMLELGGVAEYWWRRRWRWRWQLCL